MTGLSHEKLQYMTLQKHKVIHAGGEIPKVAFKQSQIEHVIYLSRIRLLQETF